MLRRVNFFSICVAFGLSVLLILAGSRYTDNANFRLVNENRKTLRTYLKIEDGEPSSQLPVTLPDSSQSEEKILEKTRLKIKNQLWNYNFSHSGVGKLEDLLLESSGQPIRSIIISTWRSGTTFLGEILNAISGSYYHYEPLLKSGIVQIRGPPESLNALESIEKMLKCDYSDMQDYFEYGKGHLHQFSHNTILWDQCKYKRALCFDANFTGKICKLFPFQTMKIVRLRLHLMKDIIKQDSLNAKVVLLVRDPRGVMQSRQHRNFCQPSRDCWNPEILCADMISDYVAAARLMKEFPNKIFVLRYEELALNPNVSTHRLLKFLKLSVTQSVEDFLSAHTNMEMAGVSSTFRVSRDVPFRWKNVLKFSYVDEIQLMCRDAMALWGYKMATNETHMTSDDFNPLQDYKIAL